MIKRSKRHKDLRICQPCVSSDTYKRGMVIATVVALTLLLPSTLVGWEHEGHEIVASLAQTHLTENTKIGIRSLIGDASLASIANSAADEVRPDRDET